MRKAFLNATHILNDTLFLSSASFDTTAPGNIYLDTEFQENYWSGTAVANNQNTKIYVADIVSNPIRLNNTRIIYSASTQVFSLYLSKSTNSVFWTTGGFGIYRGTLNITSPSNITNVTAQSMIVSNSYLPYGFYYNSQIQSLLWSRAEGSPARYFIYKSTLNLQTEMLMNTTILLNESSPITSVSYDEKNRRIFFNRPNEALLSIASFNFESPMPLTNVTEIPNIQGALSVVND